MDTECITKDRSESLINNNITGHRPETIPSPQAIEILCNLNIKLAYAYFVNRAGNRYEFRTAFFSELLMCTDTNEILI